MTANEMWENVLVTYDAVYSASAPGFTDPEAKIILSKAQWYYINQVLNPKNNRNQEGFEETEIRIQGLSALVKDGEDNIPGDEPTDANVPQTGILPNETFFALPPDFMLAIYEGAITNVPICGTTRYDRIMIVPISHDEYNINNANPYKRPWTDGTNGIVWRLEYSYKNINGVDRKIHGLITDGTFSVKSNLSNPFPYKLRYLKKPNDIITNYYDPNITRVDCELDDFTHQAIVDIAVKLLSAAVREQIPINQLTADMLE